MKVRATIEIDIPDYVISANNIMDKKRMAKQIAKEKINTGVIDLNKFRYEIIEKRAKDIMANYSCDNQMNLEDFLER